MNGQKQNQAMRNLDRISKDMMAPEDELPGYTIEVHDLGILIFSWGIEIGELMNLNKAAKAINPSFDMLAPGIASSFGAILAISSTENIPKWEKVIEKRAKRLSGGNEIREWLAGPDSGLSSIQIVHTLTKDAVAASRLKRCWSDKPYPCDPGDLGRCIRLLEKFPELKKRFGEMASLSKTWSLLVDKWDELEELYHAELNDPSLKGAAPKTFQLMKQIEDEGRQSEV